MVVWKVAPRNWITVDARGWWVLRWPNPQNFKTLAECLYYLAGCGDIDSRDIEQHLQRLSQKILAAPDLD